jgi:hypothetical protein
MTTASGFAERVWLEHFDPRLNRKTPEDEPAFIQAVQPKGVQRQGDVEQGRR